MDQVTILEIRAGWRLLNLESGEMIASFNIIANTIDERDGTLGNIPIILKFIIVLKKHECQEKMRGIWEYKRTRKKDLNGIYSVY